MPLGSSFPASGCLETSPSLSISSGVRSLKGPHVTRMAELSAFCAWAGPGGGTHKAAATAAKAERRASIGWPRIDSDQAERDERARPAAAAPPCPCAIASRCKIKWLFTVTPLGCFQVHHVRLTMPLDESPSAAGYCCLEILSSLPPLYIPPFDRYLIIPTTKVSVEEEFVTDFRTVVTVSSGRLLGLRLSGCPSSPLDEITNCTHDVRVRLVRHGLKIAPKLRVCTRCTHMTRSESQVVPKQAGGVGPCPSGL
jgi:hypothetical protein